MDNSAKIRERNVLLFNDGEEAFIERWDGMPVEIEVGDATEISFGVAEHFKQKHPDASLRIEEVPLEMVQARTPVNPLETTDRGAAFEALKKKRAPKAAAVAE